MSRIRLQNKMERTSVESLGYYEYDNKERLGFGAFAIVFKGWVRNNPKCEVAIKSIAKKNLAKSQSLLEKEIKILRELTELQHENVVALMECIDHPTHVYLVMEFCNGGDLQDYLVVQKSLNENTIRLFTQQLAGAMQALYQKGILHRDLKPQNILLKYDKKFEWKERSKRMYPHPEDITLKIADFGFARFLSDGVMAATMCGSPMYMAPEVIMSLKYDAKADLWSLGTIIYQCLVGSAPFNATTPAGLKNIYEKHNNLAPSFPDDTSPELKDLLLRMLKRNSNERISFEDFFNHPFLKPPPSPPKPKPLASPPRNRNDVTYVESFEKKKQCLYDITNCINTATEVVAQSSKSSFLQNVSPETSDDFVIVPSNLPVDRRLSEETIDNNNANNNDDDNNTRCKESNPCGCVGGNNSSPPRPLTLSIPTPKTKSPSSPEKACVSVQRTQPIKLERRDSINTDISSISPPSVQFVLGTPPLGRNSPTSAGTNVKNWAVTPGSPLRRSVVSSPLLSSPFSNFSSNNAFPKTSMGSRAITLPEFKNVGTAMGFVYPELHEGKLYQRDHTEVLTKLNFVAVLVDCILECASPFRDRSERLVLLVRALQLLSCGLNLATSELKTKRLQPSKNVKNVVKLLSEKFHKCLEDCKKLNTPSVLQKVSATPEKILYNFAIETCQKAALLELQNNLPECFKKYQMAQILLHGLTQQINHPQDKALLSKYREAVEKRLALLQDKQQYLIETEYYRVDNANNTSNDSF